MMSDTEISINKINYQFLFFGELQLARASERVLFKVMWFSFLLIVFSFAYCKCTKGENTKGRWPNLSVAGYKGPCVKAVHI